MKPAVSKELLQLNTRSSKNHYGREGRGGEGRGQGEGIVRKSQVELKIQYKTNIFILQANKLSIVYILIVGSFQERLDVLHLFTWLHLKSFKNITEIL